MCRTVSEGSAGHTSHSQDPDPAVKTGADMGVTPVCPPTKDSDDVSVTNSEVESAMGHRRRRAVLRDPGFTKEASMPLARRMHTSELLEMGLRKPQTSI